MNPLKWPYLFIAFFVLWCLISAMWYVWGVRGLATGAGIVSGHENALAILEILLMLLGSFLIGYLAAYYQQEKPLSAFREAFRLLDFKNYQLKTAQQKLDHDLAKSKQRNTALQKELDNALAQREEESQRMGRLAEQYKLAHLELRNELEEIRPKSAALATEVAHLKFKLKQQEYTNENTMGLRAPKEDEIDDLTKIRGIGPIIARRLYAAGIYSFKQISELDQKTIGQIGKILKYFPDRIKRDDWVGQARQRLAQQ